jgi:hypothetical protein
MLTGSVHTHARARIDVHTLNNQTKNTCNRMSVEKNAKKSDDSFTDGQLELDTEDLVQCPACLRRMRPSVFIKHPSLCRSNPNKSRHVNVFDMTRYRSIQSGDNVLPVRKISTTSTNNNNEIRPSRTRSAKRDRRFDTFVPPVISKFCTYDTQTTSS